MMDLEENTVFIFMTDNGTAKGAQVFNAGMRGQKGSEYDGGHRVPFYVYWPKGKLTGGRDVTQLAAHIDVRPTLVELCDLTEPNWSGSRWDKFGECSSWGQRYPSRSGLCSCIRSGSCIQKNGEKQRS